MQAGHARQDHRAADVLGTTVRELADWTTWSRDTHTAQGGPYMAGSPIQQLISKYPPEEPGRWSQSQRKEQPEPR